MIFQLANCTSMNELKPFYVSTIKHNQKSQCSPAFSISINQDASLKAA